MTLCTQRFGWTPAAPPDPAPTDELTRTILELYRTLCTEMVPATSFSPSQRQLLETLCSRLPQARTRQWWATYLEQASRITLFNGRNRRGRRVNLDWLLLPWTVHLVLSGSYNDRMDPPVKRRYSLESARLKQTAPKGD